MCLHDPPRTPEAVLNPTTHLTFSYATQLVILNDEGRIERVVAAHDVGRAINPGSAPNRWRGRTHGTRVRALRGLPVHWRRAAFAGPAGSGHRPREAHAPVDVILIEVPDEIGGYGAKGVGEIGCVATAPAGRRRALICTRYPAFPAPNG